MECATTRSTHLLLLTNQQTGGDSLGEMLVDGLQERSRLKMEELRRFTVDNQEAANIGDLEKDSGITPGGEAQHPYRPPCSGA